MGGYLHISLQYLGGIEGEDTCFYDLRSVSERGTMIEHMGDWKKHIIDIFLSIMPT